jgi:hypothetical protein
MTIINKGIFDTADVFLRQTGNDWPTAQVLSTSDITEGSNLYFTNARVYAAVSGNLALKANVSDLTTANVSELTNLYYTNARVLSYITPILTTSNVAEGSNLYYTNARVYSNVIGFLPSLAGSGIQIQANGQINATAAATSGFASTSNVANTVLSISNFTTANLNEGSNLYYTNARVLSALTGNIVVGNIVATSSVSNSYTTAGNVYAGNIIANGLIIRNITVSDIVLTGNVAAEGGLTGQTIVVTSITSNVWNGLYTANVIESASNLYFTNARVYSNIVALLPTLAGSGIQIQANGQINANVSTVLITNSDVIPVTAGNTAYTLSRVVTDPKAILVINEGLIQIPTTDYTVSGTTLTTTTQYPVGSNIEVRYFGTVSSQYSPTLSSLVNTFTGDGSNVNYTLPPSPISSAYTIVNVDGVNQLVSAYSISGSILTFTEAPAIGANIEVRVLSGTVTSSTTTSSSSTNSRILGYNLVFGG